MGQNGQVLRAIGTAIAVLLPCTGALAQGSGITLHPGLTVDFSIYGGYSSNGQLLGDYEFVNRVAKVSDGGYSYEYYFTGPAAHTGSQTVSADDNKRGSTIREYWGSGDETAKGYVSYLRLSDATFADIKAGKDAEFEFDAADNPRAVKKIGEEDLTTLVNERQTTIHTIKVQGAAGGTFWILDNAGLPMVVKGETKWKWMATAISDSGTAGAQLVSTLKTTGEATTHAILFAFNSAELDSDAKPVLDDVAAYMKSNPKVRLEVEGHTDSIGGAAFNLSLSQTRAQSVRSYLVQTGIDAGRLTAKGLGLAVPVADNATPEGRARNRRVVFRQL